MKDLFYAFCSIIAGLITLYSGFHLLKNLVLKAWIFIKFVIQFVKTLKTKRFNNKHKHKIDIKNVYSNLIYKLYGDTKKSLTTIVISLIITCFFIYNLSFLPKYVKDFSSVVILIALIIFYIKIIFFLFKPKDFPSRVCGIYVLIFIILSFNYFPFTLVINASTDSTTASGTFIIGILLAVTMSTAGIISIIKGFTNKIHVVIFTVAVLVVLYLSGGFSFGVYYYIYYSKSGFIDTNTLGLLNSFTNKTSALLIFKEFTKIGLQIFFEYPPKNIISIVSLIQFFLGKYYELVILGLIISNVVTVKKFGEIDDKTVILNEIKTISTNNKTKKKK